MLRGLLLIALAITTILLGLPLYLAGLGSVPPAPSIRPAGADLPIRVYFPDEDRLTVMPLEVYVQGVVAAEMPATFEPEALQAQAVSARTYAIRRMRVFGGSGCSDHPLADVCVDPATFQDYLTPEQMRDRWGASDYSINSERIATAVARSRGLILMFDGKPIDAVYHSTSGGSTEAAEHVWGEPVPYLVSVASPYEDHAPRLNQSMRLTWSELAQRLELNVQPVMAAVNGGRPVISALTTTPTGRINELQIAGQTFTGTDVRQRLDLNSTWFSWHSDDEGVTLQVRGYGHGVGMSQYGADGMARRGASARDILAHYYPQTDLRPIFVE